MMLQENKSIILSGSFFLLTCVLLQMNFASTQEVQQSTPVEHAQALPNPEPGTLATSVYKPSEKEKDFFSKLSNEEQTTGSVLHDYSITGKTGTYIGWFGIVRNIEENQAANETKILVEHKYFDGLTDTHIMALSFNGGGDFTANLSGTGLGIKNMSLVKIYGVVKGEINKIPEVEAEYVRHWDWGKFTFLMAYGTQKGNTKWKKINKVKASDIYDPFPDQRYYEDRLGTRKQ